MGLPNPHLLSRLLTVMAHIIHILINDDSTVRQLAVVQIRHPGMHMAKTSADLIDHFLRLISRPLPACRAKIPRLAVEEYEVVRRRILTLMRHIAGFIVFVDIDIPLP